jgi:hypothetical protein
MREDIEDIEDIDAFRPTDRQKAFHEAGHALVGRLAGFDVHEIDMQEDGPTYASVLFKDVDFEHMSVYETINWLAQTYAGPYAEALALEVSPETVLSSVTSQNDVDDADRFLGDYKHAAELATISQELAQNLLALAGTVLEAIAEKLLASAAGPTSGDEFARWVAESGIEQTEVEALVEQAHSQWDKLRGLPPRL